MAVNHVSGGRLGRSLFGLGAGACAGVPAAFVTLTLFCYATMGTDCRDGYVGMIVVAPVGILICAAAGSALAAVSAQAAAAVVGGAAGAVTGFGAGFYAMAMGASPAGLVVVPVGLAGLGAAIGWWLAARLASRRSRLPADLTGTDS